MNRRDILIKILDLARWAPSGDNTQPWRFEIVSDDHIAIHGHDTRDWCLYDFDGHASHMAHGALLETLRIAATNFELAADWHLRPDCPDMSPIYDVHLREEHCLAPDSLFPYIERRVVQRRPMRMTPLTDSQRQALGAAPGANYQVQFFETFPDRLKVARLLWNNAYIRLTCPEAYQVHREIIEWGARYSKDRIPEQAVGVDPMTARLMRWVMGSWGRVAFFNRYLGGTIPPRIQLDIMPALGCAAHLLLRPRRQPAGVADFVCAGVAMQRLWLTTTSLGLLLQPEMTPVIFRWYVRAGRTLSGSPGLADRARDLAGVFEVVANAQQEDAFVFFCRVGNSRTPGSRSVRKGLDELIVQNR